MPLQTLGAGLDCNLCPESNLCPEGLSCISARGSGGFEVQKLAVA